jgi:hypothetical protein
LKETDRSKYFGIELFYSSSYDTFFEEVAMSRKKICYLLIGAMLFVVTGLLSQGYAADVTIKVSPPPDIVISSEPDVIEIPDTNIYYIPDVQEHIIYYNGNWYRMHDNHWFTSTTYSGPWVYVESPPGVIVNLPPEYHGERRVHWRDLKRELKREHHEHEMREEERED